MFSYDQHDDNYYKTPAEFFKFQVIFMVHWYFSQKAAIYSWGLLFETNEMIVIFEANKADEIPFSQLYPITSKRIEYLKTSIFLASKNNLFLDNGEIILLFFIQTTLLIWSVNTIQTILI